MRAPGAAPPLLVLELTHRCGRRCEVCFHRDARERSIPQPDMPLALARRALRLAAAAGTVRVRLTGGEPLRHPAFATLLAETRAAGLEAWVNTAGLVEGGTPWGLLGRGATDVLLPVRDAAQRREVAAAVAAIRAGGPARVRLGVVLTRAHLDDLPAVAALAAALGCPLEAYRVMTVPGWTPGNTAADLRAAVDLLDRLNRGRPPAARVRIANAVPFCLARDRRRVARNACGGRFDDGRSRLVVAPSGQVRPSYALDLPLGDLGRTALTDLWRHPALLRLCSVAGLPDACRACAELPVCRGGSRHEALVHGGSLAAMDPLAAP
ncbi:MAG TPA: hypothetical protein VGQ83_19420 [Polyangia bacterium]